MDALVNEISTYVVLAVQSTPLGAKCADLTKIKTTLIPIFQNTFARISTQDQAKIMGFLKNQKLICECIIPNIMRIMADGKINVADAPAFLEIISGTYEAINEFLQSDKTIKLNATDIIELSALLLNVVLTIVVQDKGQLQSAVMLVNSAVKLVSITVGTKSFSFKCCCK